MDARDWTWLGVVTVGGVGAGIGAYYLLRRGPTTPQDLGGGHANANGQTVSLQISVSGRTITAVATGQGFTNPLYQFWFKPPGSADRWVPLIAAAAPYITVPVQGGWVHWYGYGPANTVEIPALVPGTYQLVVYARESTAPYGETATQRATYEAESDMWQVGVA